MSAHLAFSSASRTPARCSTAVRVSAVIGGPPESAAKLSVSGSDPQSPWNWGFGFRVRVEVRIRVRLRFGVSVKVRFEGQG